MSPRKSPHRASVMAAAPPPFRLDGPAGPADSDSDTDSDESIVEVLANLRKQMDDVFGAAGSVRSQMKQLFRRAKTEITDWTVEPLQPKPRIQKWLADRGVTETTIEALLTAVFAAAESVDLESRVLTFKRPDAAALFQGERQVTLFDLIARVPEWVE